MFTTGPAFWYVAAPSAPSLGLPYTMTFNFTDKAAMIAAYAADGITVDALVDGEFVDETGIDGFLTPGAMSLTDSYYVDVLDGPLPASSASPPQTKYCHVSGVGVSFPFDFSITLPDGALVRQVSKQFWRIGSSTMNMVLTYNDGFTLSEGSPSSGSNSTPMSQYPAFPTTPQVGRYIKKITFRLQSPGTWFAVDNIVLIP